MEKLRAISALALTELQSGHEGDTYTINTANLDSKSIGALRDILANDGLEVIDDSKYTIVVSLITE